MERLRTIEGACQGINSYPPGKIGYDGPAPPPGKLHHYVFKLYALSRPLDLPPGADKATLMAAMKDRVLAEGRLVGTYQR